MNHREHLIHMANQIARNFARMGPEDAAHATADHITDFWDPRMKRAIITDGSGLSALARAAIAVLQANYPTLDQRPPGSPGAPRSAAEAVEGPEPPNSCRASLAYEAAVALLRANAEPLGRERINLAQAGGRVLADPVRARIDVPAYDAAAMDGYAVTAGSSQDCHIVGHAWPAKPWRGRLQANEAVRVMTGACVPAGADRVIALEETTVADGLVRLSAATSQRRHIRERGSDISAGRIALPAATLLDPRCILVAAAADVDAVEVYREPRVSIITSGDELVPPGQAAERPGMVPDSLTQALELMVRQWGGRTATTAMVADRPAAIASAGRLAAKISDVLVIVGGASRGDRDFAKQGFARLGMEIVFANVAMKPAKPLWYGRIGERHVIGLPGNPTAAITAARLFLVPLLCALVGRGFEAGLSWGSAPLKAAIPAAGERTTFLCATLGDEGVEIIARQSASDQLMLARANALALRLPGAPPLPKGAMMPTLPF